MPSTASLCFARFLHHEETWDHVQLCASWAQGVSPSSNEVADAQLHSSTTRHVDRCGENLKVTEALTLV